MAQLGMRFVRDTLGEHLGQARLADARLASDQNDLAPSLPGQFLAAEQKFHLSFSIDEVGELAGTYRLETAFRVGLADDRPGFDRLGVAFEIMSPKVAELEQLADQPPRGRSDHDHAGFRQALDPIGEVRRIAHDGSFLRHPGTDQFAHDHRAGRYSHSRRQRLATGRAQLTDRGQHVEAGAHRPFRVVLMGARIAEINQQAIAQEPREKAVIGRQYGGTGFLIGADDCMHFFRIEARGERGRADKVAEHHRQLAALGY